MRLWLKGYKSKKQLIKENEDLRKALEKEEKATFDDYFLKNTTISTTNGLEVAFKGTELVKIFAASFWELVQDSDNYLIIDLNSADGKGVEVTIKKKGKLSPQEKLKKVESLLTSLLAEIDSDNDSAVKAREYLNCEEDLRKKYNEK